MVVPRRLHLHVVPAIKRLKIDDSQHETARMVRNHAVEQTKIGTPEAFQIEGGLQVENGAFAFSVRKHGETKY